MQRYNFYLNKQNFLYIFLFKIFKYLIISYLLYILAKMGLSLNIYDLMLEVLNEEVSPKEVSDAISKKYQVIINYSDEDNAAPRKRLIEPYVYGLSKAGNGVIRAYQYNGDTRTTIPKWKLFRLDRITSWQPTGRHFTLTPRENGWNAEEYNREGDKSMSTIYSQVTFDGSDNTDTYSPNDRLNQARKRTAQLKNSTPLNIKDLNNDYVPSPNNTNVPSGVNNQNGVEQANGNNNGEEIKAPEMPKNTEGGPVGVTNNNNNNNFNDPKFQDMLKRNLAITQKEKDRRGFSLNNRNKNNKKV